MSKEQQGVGSLDGRQKKNPCTYESKHALGFHINRIRCSDKENLQTLQHNQASYHPSCKNKYNNLLQKDMKQKKATENNDIQSLPYKRRYFVTPITSNQITCCFCIETDTEENLIAAGTLHASKTKTVANHVKKLTQTWIEMAKSLKMNIY